MKIIKHGLGANTIVYRDDSGIHCALYQTVIASVEGDGDIIALDFSYNSATTRRRMNAFFELLGIDAQVFQEKKQPRALIKGQKYNFEDGGKFRIRLSDGLPL